MTATGAVTIDVVFDTVCPWCFIGRRRLQRALAMRPEVPVQVTWRPFLLNPDMPASGIDRRAYMKRKYGSSHRVNRIERAIAAAGRLEGIDFALEKIKRTPDSLLSHRLVRLAAGWDLQDEAVEAVFTAFFIEARDIGDVRVLAEIAESIGLPPRAVERLGTPDDWHDFRRETQRAHRLGVDGVPCFVFQQRYSLAGAQEAPILARMIDLARESALAGDVRASV